MQLPPPSSRSTRKKRVVKRPTCVLRVKVRGFDRLRGVLRGKERGGRRRQGNLLRKVPGEKRAQGVVDERLRDEKRAQGVNGHQIRDDEGGKAMIVSRDWDKSATDGGRGGGPAAEDRAVRRRRRREELAARGLDYNPLGGSACTTFARRAVSAGFPPTRPVPGHRSRIERTRPARALPCGVVPPGNPP